MNKNLFEKIINKEYSVDNCAQKYKQSNKKFMQAFWNVSPEDVFIIEEETKNIIPYLWLRDAHGEELSIPFHVFIKLHGIDPKGVCHNSSEVKELYNILTKVGIKTLYESSYQFHYLRGFPEESWGLYGNIAEGRVFYIYSYNGIHDSNCGFASLYGTYKTENKATKEAKKLEKEWRS